MPLKTTTGYNDNYTISLADFSSFPIGSCITLYDSYTNVTTDLRNSNYVFALTDTTTASRFTLNITMSPLNITSGLIQPTCSLPNIGAISAKGVSAGPWNYYWKDANGVTIKTSLNKATADTIINLFGGNYNLEVNTVGLCDHNDSQFYINTIEIPVAQFSSIDTAYISNGAVSFTNTSVNTLSNTWDFGDMSGTSTSFDPSYNYSTVGVYTVSLITESSTGCLDTTQKSIVVILENTAGIKDLQNTMGLLLKTLDNDVFMLNGTYTESEKVQISVRDVQGKNVYDFGFINSQKIQLPIDLSSVNSGIYYLEISGNKTKVVYKLPVK
jgi:PKD repeat protein